MEPIYYYKTASDIWHFSTGVSLEAMKGNDYLRRLRASVPVMRLYLNEPDHFEIIKRVYKTPDYWEGMTWQDEYNEKKTRNETLERQELREAPVRPGVR